ncbi:MAG: endonuclease domain-containing protein [Comamonadaceae bacterium]|nr:MAG: endonuclease domain-containing protein [Comamonadaceae bacterium]
MRARALRQNQTDAEALMWSKLRDRRFLNLKFRRQHPISGYFADFACIDIMLVVELDGGQHADAADALHDARRADDMAAEGFTTVRFWNNDVLAQTESVMAQLLVRVQALTPTLSRKREREPVQAICSERQMEPMQGISSVRGAGQLQGNFI